MRIERRAQRREDAGRLVVRPEDRGVAARARRPPRAPGAAGCGAAQPALRAAPLDQRARPAARAARRSAAPTGATARSPRSPRSRACARGEVLVGLFAQPGPEGARLGRVDALAAEPGRGRVDRRHRALQAQHQRAVPPGAGVERQRLAGPGVELRDRRCLRHLEAQRGRRPRHRQHLQRDLADHAQRAQRAREQARHVVAGDVLHHLAAEAQQLAAPVEQRRAEHVVAHAADRRARRPGKARRDHAADGGGRRRSAAARTAGTGRARRARPRARPAACRSAR